jgi:hypothetical protein
MTRADPELRPPKPACAGDVILRTSTQGTVPVGQCSPWQRGSHLTVSISTNDLHPEGGYMAVGSFLFLKEQIKGIITIC